ncbi:MAG: hypothetical protein OWU32_07430 [Firmicutes bacterium]|nr:hypothetical protein [Bacillota bacterium]
MRGLDRDRDRGARRNRNHDSRRRTEVAKVDHGRKIARRLLSCAIFGCSLLLSGCWDNHELEDLAFVTVIGLDVAPGNNLRITYQYLTPPAEDPRKGNTGKTPLTTTFLVPSFGSAPMIAATTTDRLITAQQVKALVISEELAHREDILPFLDGMVRERAYRRDVLLVTSLDSARAFMRANRSKLGSNTLTYIENMRHQHLYTGMFPEVTLNDFLIASETTDQLGLMGLAAIASKPKPPEKSVVAEGQELPGSIQKKGGDNGLQFSGAAVYQGGRDIGRLTGQEVRCVLLLRGDIGTFSQTVMDPFRPGMHDTLQVFQVIPPSIHPTLRRGRLSYRIDVNLYGALSSETSKVDYVQTLTSQKKLREAFETMMESDVSKLLRRSQTEFRGDVCQLDRALRWRFWTEDDWKRFNYTKHFEMARFDVRFHLHLKEFGKQRYFVGR